MKGLVKKKVYIHNTHRQQCGDGQQDGGVEAEWRWAKGDKMATSAIVLTIKIKVKD